MTEKEKTVIELDDTSSAVVFTEHEDGKFSTNIYVPDYDPNEEVRPVHVYCIAIAALVEDPEFVDYTVTKFMEKVKLAEGDTSPA